MADIIVGAVVVILLVLAVFSIIKRNKNGNGCGGSCAGCCSKNCCNDKLELKKSESKGNNR